MIEKKVLIGYLSPHGTTKEVAEFLKSEFLLANIPTDVQELEKIINIEPYLGLILAAPIQGMKWHPTASDFFMNHRHQYRQRVLGLVATSYMIKTARPNIRTKLSEFFKHQPQLQPHDLSAVFGGRISSPLPWFARVLFGVPLKAPLDTLDWEEIKAWAKSFIAKVEAKAEYQARIQRGGFE